MTNYAKGAAFEYRVRDAFARKGFVAQRKAGSSPYDLMILKEGRVLFIIDAKKTSQAKRHVHVRRADIEKLIREAATVGAEPLITYGFQRTPIFVAFARELNGDGKTVRLEEGLELEHFLEKYLKGSG